MITVDETAPTPLPPQNNPRPNPPIPTTQPASGLAVIRLEQYGLPLGYMGTVVLTRMSDVALTPDILSQYSIAAQQLLQQRSYRFFNQQVIQVELPLGGPANVRWAITPANSVLTPNKEIFFSNFIGLQENSNEITGYNGVLYNIGIVYDGVLPPVKQHVQLPESPIRYIDIKNVNTDRLTEPVPLTNSGIESTPLTYPVGTKIATSIKDMYLYAFNTDIRKWVYNVGKPITSPSLFITLKNVTVSTQLQFKMILPSFLFTNIPTTFVLNPNTQVEVDFALNENDAIAKSSQISKLFTESFKLSVMPLNVNGPVLVGDVTPLPTTPTAQTPQGNNVPVQSPSSPTRIYMELTPAYTTLRSGQEIQVELKVYIGPDDGNVNNSTLVQFPENGIQWKTSSSTVAYVSTMFSNQRATIGGLNRGHSEFTAQIVSLPINVSQEQWLAAYGKVLGINVKRTDQTLVITGNVDVVDNQTTTIPTSSPINGGNSSTTRFK